MDRVDPASHDNARSVINLTTLVVCMLALAVAYSIAATIQDVFFGPLSKFPGPRLYAWTRLPLIWAQIRGHDNQIVPALHAKYGPAVRIAPRELSFASAQAWQDIYGFKKAGQPKLQKDPNFYLSSYNKVHSLATADDATHSRQRKILSHAFSDRAMREQQPILRHWANNMLERLKEASQHLDQIDMLKFYNCTTFDIMGDLSFSEGLNMLAGSELDPWVKTIFTGLKVATIMRGVREINVFMDWVVRVLLSHEWVRKKEKEHWDYSTNRVNRRLKKTPERPDLWTRVIEHSDGPNGLSLGEHHSIASIFMIAGTETTATALSGTTYQLLRHPKVMAKLVQEIRAHFQPSEEINFESMAKMKYLHAVLQEGLRIYPPAPSKLPRKVLKGGTSVNGQWIPEDTIISIHQVSTYQLKSNFKYANEFRPERWLGDPQFEGDKLDAFEPFSVGPRNCIGKNLAWHEMRLLLVTVLLHFDLQLCEESRDWSRQRVFTLWEKVPLMFQAVGFAGKTSKLRIHRLQEDDDDSSHFGAARCGVHSMLTRAASESLDSEASQYAEYPPTVTADIRTVN